MPMYEYGCDVCHSHFELLRRMDQDEKGLTCPACGSEHVHRQLSVFAAHSRGGSLRSEVSAMSAPAGGGCGSGCCGGTCASRN
ncbi:FmdB family zinc ribbon protein [Candidatus Chloroploca asiatica]|uniref:FmdB family zinc ribbon protein n=1 Tax=Candidatus Chloroploca asiatica TaxID=1506545 RepID=UPI001558CD96